MESLSNKEGGDHGLTIPIMIDKCTEHDNMNTHPTCGNIRQRSRLTRCLMKEYKLVICLGRRKDSVKGRYSGEQYSKVTWQNPPLSKWWEGKQISDYMTSEPYVFNPCREKMYLFRLTLTYIECIWWISVPNTGQIGNNFQTYVSLTSKGHASKADQFLTITELLFALHWHWLASWI